MRTSVKIIKNTNKWESIKKNLMAQSKIVEVGFINRSSYSDGTTVAQVAQWNEEGHINERGAPTPMRPFMRTALMDFMKDRVRHHIGKVGLVASGHLSWDALHRSVASELEDSIRKSIIDWKIPPNSPYTVSLKGFNDPLIDSGKMLNNITHRIKGKANV